MCVHAGGCARREPSKPRTVFTARSARNSSAAETRMIRDFQQIANDDQASTSPDFGISHETPARLHFSRAISRPFCRGEEVHGRPRTHRCARHRGHWFFARHLPIIDVNYFIYPLFFYIISGTFNYSFELLFNFRSHYLFAIGVKNVFRFRWNIPPGRRIAPSL